MEGRGREANQTELDQLSFGVHSDGPSEISSEEDSEGSQQKGTQLYPLEPLCASRYIEVTPTHPTGWLHSSPFTP